MKKVFFAAIAAIVMVSVSNAFASKNINANSDMVAIQADTTVTDSVAPAVEQPATEAPATEQPATEAPAVEQPAAEAPATEQPATEAPATEQPAAEVKVDWNQVNSTLSGNGQKADKDGNVSLVTGNKIEVPAASLDSLKKSGNKTLVMHTGTGLAFSISSKNITNSASGKTLNLAIREGQFQVSAQEVAAKTKNAVAMKTISMANHESFGMVVNLHMNLGKENSGKFANFYRKNDATGKLEYMGCFKIALQ